MWGAAHLKGEPCSEASVCVHGCRHVCLYALRARSKSRCILYICADIVLCQRMNPVIEAVCTKALYFGIGSVLDLFS